MRVPLVGLCGVWSMKIAILSGCRYTDCGGAQRPPALARSFIEFGHEVEYTTDSIGARRGAMVSTS